jgi:HD-like signal output (HDOD) protein
MTDAADPVEKIASRARELFTLPSVAVRVLELTENPKVDVRALKQCVENDPALTAKVLRVVNSSLFGLSREVSDLNQALALLGTKPLKLLVLGFSLPDALFRGVGAAFLDQYWRRTLTRAVVARELAEQYWRVPGDDAFIAALLEDIGLLVLAQELGETWITFYDRVSREHADLLAMENKALGFDHTTLTVRLVDQWRLPAMLSTAISAANAPERMKTLHGAELELSQVLRLSNLFADLLADGRAEALPELHRAGKEYRGLTDRDFDELRSDLDDRVSQLAEALSLELPRAFQYDQVWKTAHERLIVAAAEVAGDIVRMRIGSSREEELRLLEECQSLGAAVKLLASNPVRLVERKAPVAVVATPDPPKPKTNGGHGPRPLHERPSADESDPGIAGRLVAAVAAARQARCSVSLLCVEVDRQDELLLHLGPSGMRQWVARVYHACDGIDHDPPAQCVDLSDGRWMIVLVDCDRRQAVEYGQQILRMIRTSTQPKTDVRLSISVGAASVAVPSPNFPARDLLTSAERCLQAALASGGDVLKSIEIY